MSALARKPPTKEGSTSATMNDNYISRAAVAAASLWASAVVLVLTTWGLAFADAPVRWVRPIEASAILAAAVAVASQIRLYALRMCCLIRVTSGLETPDAQLAHIGPRSQSPG